MLLTFSEVLPVPLRGMQFSHESFWHSGTIHFEPAKNYEIIATSGKGKTSLLDILFGRRHDYYGQYSIDGQSAEHISLSGWADMRRLHLSYVFQGLRLFRHLTGWENITMNNRLTQYLSAQQIETYAQKLDIAAHLSKKAGHLSYGQQQRLALIRALAQPFDRLLLDEPFSHLDQALAHTAAQLITEECTQRNASFIVTRLSDESYLKVDQKIVL